MSASLVNQDHETNSGGHLQNVTRNQLQRGDLIAYPGHIVIYLSNGQILETSPPKVQIASADKYWNRSDVVFRRVLF
ncbi:MAG: NlpC/P60 family protein [Granulosicoccus sp.]